MGFAVIKEREVRKPTCKGTVVCQNCDAEFSQITKWVRGYYDRGSTSLSTNSFIMTSKVNFGYCPVCNTKVF